MEKELSEVIKTGEGYHIEFKENLDKSLMKEVCAFANSSGGKMLLGVIDDGEIKGIKTDNSFLSQVQDTVNKLDPKLKIKISHQDNIVIVDVPEGTDKPYKCSSGFYIRIGPNSQKLERDEIIAFCQKEGLIRFDEQENLKANFNTDFDEKAYNRFIELSGITPTIDRDMLLKNLGCMTDSNKLTNAGVLFFCKID